jgi:SAM-dependent methyltransferase
LGESPGFWSDPETVARFRDRDPDIHLVAILEEERDPTSLRVLDLGCAGGRNSAELARRGVPTIALDASAPMCAATRDREGTPTIQGVMDTLPFPDRRFDLVVALGVYHQASSGAELRRALEETRRVLRPGGRVLLATFAREMAGEAEAFPGEPLVFPSRHGGGRVALLEEDQLLRLAGEVGLAPTRPVETRRGGDRVSLLGLFRREEPAG